MTDVPRELLERLMRGREPLIAEIAPREAGNRAWVKLQGYNTEDLIIRKVPGPNRRGFFMLRFDIPAFVVAEIDNEYDDSSYMTHREELDTYDLAEALTKAAEYEPDWSKWGTSAEHPHCP